MESGRSFLGVKPLQIMVPGCSRETYIKRVDYYSYGSCYVDFPRGTSRSSKRAYADDGYSQRFERLPLSYRKGRTCGDDSVSGSKFDMNTNYRFCCLLNVFSFHYSGL